MSLQEHIGIIILIRGVIITLSIGLIEIVSTLYIFKYWPNSNVAGFLWTLLSLLLLYVSCFSLSNIINSLCILKGNYWLVKGYKDNYKESNKWQL